MNTMIDNMTYPTKNRKMEEMYHPFLPIVSIKELIACPKLKVLILDGIFLTDESAKYLLEYPSLTTVHFNYCGGLTDETPKILSQASNIKVKFHMCKNISQNAIDEYKNTARN